MNILLDTHITIWVATDDDRLSPEAKKIILAPENRIYYSTASVIEVDWKTRSKNNNLGFNTDEYIEMCHDARYIPIALKEEYIAKANHLIWNGESVEHKDPFDRMLLAQAMVEGMKFMTHDRRDFFPRYVEVWEKEEGKKSCQLSKVNKALRGRESRETLRSPRMRVDEAKTPPQIRKIMILIKEPSLWLLTLKE